MKEYIEQFWRGNRTIYNTNKKKKETENIKFS